MTEQANNLAQVDVLAKKIVMAAVQAQADYEVANFKRSRTSADAAAHYEAAMRAALEAIGLPELIAAVSDVYGNDDGPTCATPCPSCRIQAALAALGGAK